MEQVWFSQETETIPMNFKESNAESSTSDIKACGPVDQRIHAENTRYHGFALQNQVGESVQTSGCTPRAHRSSNCRKEPLTWDWGNKWRKFELNLEASVGGGGCVGVCGSWSWGNCRLESTGVPAWVSLARAKKLHKGEWRSKKGRWESPSPPLDL